ncbi:MAG TPA: FMN-binding protein [Aggregatilineales bacterium]|nr:FMN-binding protein [Aggregatilineales bacterium]
MPKAQPARSSDTLKKYLLSSLVVATFSIYAIHERYAAAGSVVVSPTAINDLASAGANGQSAGTVRGNAPDPNQSVVQDPPSPVPAQNGQYRDGQYVGQPTDAYYGMVQVEAVVHGGKVVDVQFLDYPHDRRTSQFINSQAMPYLKSEAIQAQNAQVDIISGATLTSEAFAQSLQTALDQAHS